MKYIWVIFAVLFAIIASHFATLKLAEVTGVDECRKLASSPDEPNNRDGVELSEINLETAYKACSAAAIRRDATAADHFRFGRVSLAKGAYAEAIKWTKNSADQNYAPAQYQMGLMYDDGRGVERNVVTALGWYRKAADQGNALAQYEVGLMYTSGNGVKRNFATAADWFNKAAIQGHAASQYNLGMEYHRGRTLPKNYSVGTEWFRKAADQGYVYAQHKLGVAYLNGLGVTQDHTIAAEWFRKAALKEVADAQIELGRLYLRGLGVPRSNETAADWFRKAASQGSAEGQFSLGVMYEAGDGVPRDEIASKELYRKAASQGHEQAQLRFSQMTTKTPLLAGGASKNDGSDTAAAILGGILLWGILSGGNSESEKEGDAGGKKCHLEWQKRRVYASPLGHGDDVYRCDLDEIKDGDTCSRQVEVCN